MTLAPADHLKWIMQRLPVSKSEECSVQDALGRILASAVRAPHALPIWDNSAMDGYALRSADLNSATTTTPVFLQVIGEVRAGSSADPHLESGQTVRIMTGAPMPSNADAIVAVEQTIGETGPGQWATHSVQFTSPVDAGKNLRKMGEDVALGAVLAEAGQHLSAFRLAALAATGVTYILVATLPRVTVLITGAELKDAGTRLERGQIPESNSMLLSGLLGELGIPVTTVRRNADDPQTLERQLAELSATSDVIISTGGVGPGTHDVMRQVLADEPGVIATRVAIRPGQLQSVGRLRSGAFIFALPGNPVSAAVSFELFVRPALLALQGATHTHRIQLSARAGVAWPGAVGRLQVLPVVITSNCGELSCVPAVNPRGISQAVGGHGTANGYALVGPEISEVEVGDVVRVVMRAP